MHVPSQVSHRGSMAYSTKPNGLSSTVPTSMGPSHALVSLAVNFSRRRACCTASRASSAVPRGPIEKPSASLVIFAPGPYRGFQCFPAQDESTLVEITDSNERSVFLEATPTRALRDPQLDPLLHSFALYESGPTSGSSYWHARPVAWRHGPCDPAWNALPGGLRRTLVG